MMLSTVCLSNLQNTNQAVNLRFRKSQGWLLVFGLPMPCRMKML
ncbi:hypothetical protein SOVF_023390 [Spinacia oleracea]|nr:hypothetical protein SOVF_023390 [Spinacia oleracea]